MDELETLRASTELFVTNLSPHEVMSIAAERAKQISQATYCEIFSSHPNGKDFVSTVQLSEGNLPINIANLSQKLALEAIEQQRTIITSDVESEGQDFNLPCWLVFPLKAGGNLVGAISLGHESNEACEALTVNLLSIFVDQASIAISNTQLFEDLSIAYDTLAQSRQEILNSRNTLQTLFDGITDGLYIIDQAFNIIMVNQAEINRLEKPAEEIKGTNFKDLGWEEVAPEFVDLIKSTFRSGQKTLWRAASPSDSVLLKDRDMNLYPIVSSENTVRQVIILAQDVSKQRQLQASLFQSAHLTAIGQLATSVAHEINNPLTIGLTNAQMLMMELDTDDDEIYALAEEIFEANNRIKDIVSNLVDVANQDSYLFDKIDLISNLEGALELIAHPLRRGKIKVDRQYQVSPTVYASSSHLKMVWMNLLLNARDAILATKQRGTITIKISAADPDLVKVVIEDTGIGLQEAHVKMLFRPFFTTKPVGEALGLGLFNTHTIIERHKGSIHYQNGEANTQFVVFLPETSKRPEGLPFSAF